jgi:hypothetical protein
MGCLIRLSYPALVVGCPTPERVRQFSLAPLTHFCVLSSLRRVSGSTIACRPAAGLAPFGATRLFVGRHARAFAPVVRVRVAQP